MDEWHNITKNLGTLIKTSGKTQTEIAHEIGIKHQVVSEYVTGKSYPSLVTLKKLCQVLDCNYEDILGTP